MTKLDDRLGYEAVGRLASVARLASIYGSFGDRDTQTGLPNRQGFQRYLAELRPAPSHGLGLLILDIDHLRLINDKHGREAGDAMIAMLADRLSSGLPNARVFRIGSDEFAVVIDFCCLHDDVDKLAARVQDIVSAPSEFLETLEPLTVTMGGVVLSIGSADTGSMLQHATFALCFAKDHHRSGYVRYRPEIRSDAEKAAADLNDISSALDEGRLRPYYQPLIDLGTSKIIGVEALARIHTVDGGIIGADKLVSALQHPTLALRITDEIFAWAARDIAQWIEAGIPFKHVGLNLTQADLLDPRIEERLSCAFARAKVPLEHVVLEITETVYLDGGHSEVAQSIKRLRRSGILVALDDFGTGFASLTHLLSLPVDIIKIDKSFVQGMVDDHAKQVIVKGVIDIARQLGMRIVAEGIEQMDQAEMLRAMGATLGQGFLFSRPVDAKRMLALLRQFAQYPDAGAHEQKVAAKAEFPDVEEHWPKRELLV